MSNFLSLHPPYRYATVGDALAMAELANMAGEGLPLYSWSRMAVDGKSPWQIGQERARRESGAFSYRNTIVREQDDAVVACMIGYPLSPTTERVDYTGIPPMFVPLQELEDMAAGTWHINVLATYPDYRRRGIAREFLQLAEALALNSGSKGLSLIVADSNRVARKLYEEQGFREHAKRKMVREQWQNQGSDWILLHKAV